MYANPASCGTPPGKAPPRVTVIGRWLAVATLALVFTGCAAVSNPVADGIPVRRLPAEHLAIPKSDLVSVPLSYLRQRPPEVYRVGPGDVLGIYIEGVLGQSEQGPPVRLGDADDLPPAIGYPFPIREDGTLALPLIGKPLEVGGKTLVQVQEIIFDAYTQGIKPILEPSEARIIVTRFQDRETRVLVIREDSGSIGLLERGIALGSVRRGQGQVVNLPAYQNDVLTALTRTGGLPDPNAANEVVIQRGYYRSGTDLESLVQSPDCALPQQPPLAQGTGRGNVIRIPLRLKPGEALPFGPQDIVLRQGDIVFIPARDTEVFYTGGVLLPRQFVLPRDLDIRVVEAIALAGGPLLNGLIAQNNLAGNVAALGLGSPTPSRVTVLRKTGNYGQIRIQVDLYRALRDPRENIIIKPGDVIILQETPGEAITRYLTGIIQFDFFGRILRGRDATLDTTVIAP